MTEPKFTPGPWHVENRHKPYVMQQNGIALAEVWELSVISREQAVANANLIAVAPEMYEILVSECLGCGLCNGKLENAPACKIARVLSKARGESEVKHE